jgi:D-alanyl-D-alanine carboxypeptidase
LNLNDRLVDHLSEFKSHKDRRFCQITIGDLLANRSGLQRDSLHRDYWGLKQPFLNREELICEVLSNALIYAPGSCTKYSNIGFALLGLVIEKVSGVAYSKFVKGMLRELRIRGPLATDIQNGTQLSQGHLRIQPGRKLRQIKGQSTLALAAAAGVCTNTDTLTDFFHKLYATNHVLSKVTRNLLLQKKWRVAHSASDEYGLGTIFSSVAGIEYIGHTGGVPGFASQTWVLPDSDYTIGFITNVSVAKTFNYVRGIAEILQLMDQHFKSEQHRVRVSRPMVDNQQATIFVVGRSKALAFALSEPLPTEEVVVFKKQKDYFVTHQMSGYKCIGEPVKFQIQSGQIVSVKFGGFHAMPLKN